MEYISIAFTGHRPNRLYGYDLNNPRYKQLSKILKELLDKIDYDDISVKRLRCICNRLSNKCCQVNDTILLVICSIRYISLCKILYKSSKGKKR